MKVNCKYKRKLINENNKVELTFEVDSYLMELLQELKSNIDYRLQVDEIKTKRTVKQNKLMWELIHQIAITRGSERANDDWQIYLEALERAGAKYEYVAVVPDAVNLIKNQFRAVQVVNEFEHKNKTFVQLKVYYGSSKMNSKEMYLLLETIKDMAVECGVDIDEFNYTN